MFMFVFTIILISLVGLFLQVVNALVLFLASQHMGMGQQAMVWQNLAKEYACLSSTPYTGTLDTSTDPTVASGIRGVRTEYQGRNWGSVIFTGSQGGSSNIRLVMTYITPGTTYAGLSSSEVVRQFRAAFKNNEYRFSAVYTGASSMGGAVCPDRCMDIVVSDATNNAAVTVSGIPPTVPTGASGMVSSVDCPH